MPFSGIPGYSELFRKYIDLDEAALRFYQQPPLLRHLEAFSSTSLQTDPFPRQELASTLHRQNARLDADETTARSIDELRHPDAVAVVTGQQTGLFGGPLYTLYKALTTIRLASELRLHGIRAVPVFWMECEDHDLAEVTHNVVFMPDATVRTFDFGELLFGEERHRARPVGTLVFGDRIREALAQYSGSLPEGPYLETVGAQLESIYLPGAGFADAFGRLMARMLRGRGLVFYNPSDAEGKRLAAPVFRKALERAQEIYTSLSERNESLRAAGFDVQVGVPENSTTLFLIQDGERRALQREGNRINLKNSARSFGRAELSRLLEESPELFSPNVLLRPLVQDHLFPTVAYVAGPSETSYFAQLEGVYRLFGRAQPVIWPRDSFTLIDPEVDRAMTEAGVDLTDCFSGKRQVAEKLAESNRHSDSGSLLKHLGEEIERSLQTVRPAMVVADASLGPALDTAKRKMLHHVETLRTRFINQETAENDALGGKADQILNFCYPNNVMQEREFGIHQFLVRHGPGILDTIFSLMEPGHFAHIAVNLQSGSHS
jgi:bacillithiol biosynthesis cysteine-adding enzyme BshC